jgi:hypothetical protein
LVLQPREPQRGGYSKPRTAVNTTQVKIIGSHSRLNNNKRFAFIALANDGVKKIFNGDERGKPVPVPGTENLEFVSALDINDTGEVFGAGDNRNNNFDTYILGRDGKERRIPSGYTAVGTMEGPVPTRLDGVAYKSDGRIEIIDRKGRRTTVAREGSGILGDGFVINQSGKTIVFFGIPSGRKEGYTVFRWTEDDGKTVDLLADRPPYASIDQISGSENGQVAVCYEKKDGTQGVDLLDARGQIFTVADTKGGFEKSVASFALGGVNDKGIVIFIASLKGSSKGIFVGTDRTRVIGVGDALDGATISHLAFAANALSPKGDILFSAVLSDGRSGLYIISPIGGD